MSSARFCASCGASLDAAARFCHRCGTAADGSSTAAPRATTAPRTAGSLLPWTIAGIAVLSLVAFVAGQNFRKAPPAAPAPNAPFAGGAQGGTPGRAPDISQMGPEERADRYLFQMSSARFCASCGASLDAAARFMRTAGMQLDTLAKNRHAARLAAVVDRERAKNLTEYIDHGPDIDAALRESRGGASAPVPAPR